MMYCTSLSEYMLVRPDAGVIMQQREIRNRAHGHDSIEVSNFAARVPKRFARVYSDVQDGLDESKRANCLTSRSGKKKKVARVWHRIRTPLKISP